MSELYEGDKINNENLPSGWIQVRIKDVVNDSKQDIVDGPFGSNLKSSEYVSNGIPLIRLQNVERNYFINKNTKYITKEKAEQLKRHSFIQNDIVITKLGFPVGKACIVPHILETGIIVADIIRIRMGEEFVLRKFLTYIINSEIIIKQFSVHTKGTTRPRVNLTKFRNFQIPLPPLNEQKRIVSKIESILSQIDACKGKLGIVKKLLKQNKQAVLRSAFEGRLVPQNSDDEPAEVLLRKIHADSKKLVFDNENLPSGWVNVALNKISEINPKKSENEIIDDELKVSFIPMKCVEELTGNIDLSIARRYVEVKKNYTYFKNGDIIFAKITPCMENGKVAIVHELKNGIGFGSTEFHVIRFNHNLDRMFYFHYLIHDDFRNVAQIHMKGTAGQLRVPSDYLKDVLIPLPPLNEQKRIVSKIESILGRIDAIEKQVDDSLTNLDQLKKSVLKRAFEGKLVPQDPNDEPASVLLEKIKQEKIAQNRK